VFAAAAIAEAAQRPVLLVVGHLDEADAALDELTSEGVEASRLAALEAAPGESGQSIELFAERIALMRAVMEGMLPRVLVSPIHALMQAVPRAEQLPELILRLTPARGGTNPRAGLKRDEIVRWLDSAGYSRCDSIEEPGDFAIRGGIIDVFPPGGRSTPVRLDFFGDELETITEIDLETMGSDRRLDDVELVGARPELAASKDDPLNFLEVLPKNMIVLVSEPLEVLEQARGYFERVLDGSGVFGPPAVFQVLQSRFAAYSELGQFTGTLSGSAGRGTRAGQAGAIPPDGAMRDFELPVSALPEFPGSADEAVRELGRMTKQMRVRVLCQNEAELQRFTELVSEFITEERGGGRPAREAIERDVAYMHRGFVWGHERPVAFVPYHELLHRFNTRRRGGKLRAARAADAFLDLEPGDFVVHSDHGVARFIGLEVMKPRSARPNPLQRAEQQLRAARGETIEVAPVPGEEYLTLEFANKARLHVPVSQIEKVQRYVGGHAGKPPLSTLGGRKWERQKEQVRAAVRDLAAELLRIQAARASTPGVRYPPDTPWQMEFEAEFPFEETEDQLAALVEIKRDMSSSRPMDRLLCGDVGYGKTELAIRAAFKAAEFGKQVAVLVPTTILAEQHERTFRARFADYPFKVASVSRFKSHKEQQEILRDTAEGRIDILIGTHRLLSKDVRFADLGLVVIDEEQRFGVEHKNALLAFRMTADVLTLSATPIPRTLHMAMLGLRDISSLTTAPVDRRAVVTEVAPYNEVRIRRAIERELARDGQVFFVHNRVHDIRSVADGIQRLVPHARIVIGHGQMPEHELEEVMRRFVRRQADILVSTTIIESGIDIPTANTIFINNADQFGLADLHQLRGRVGRYKHRAYCYLLLSPDRPVTDVAARRLRAVEEFSMLGAGFKIAMRDLEIRGAGNLLGAEQSGHIAAVGYDMYCRLLDEAARDLRNEHPPEQSGVTVEIGISGSLPKPYIPSDKRRLEAYRRIATARSQEELRKVEADLREAYGEPPKAARRLLDLALLRVLAAGYGVRSVVLNEQDVVFRTRDPAALAAALDRGGARDGVSVRVIEPVKPTAVREVFVRPPAGYLEGETLLRMLIHRLKPVSQMAAK